MIATASVCASRNNSDRSVLSLPDANLLLGVIVRPEIGLIDCTNLGLGQLPIDVIADHAEQLRHLILDGNELTEHSFLEHEQALETGPCFDNLQTLSLNGNRIVNVGILLQFLSRKCPNLKCLSLIGNPGWPHPINAAHANQYNGNGIGNGNNGRMQQRLYKSFANSAVGLLPSLRFLDSSAVLPKCRRNSIESTTSSGSSGSSESEENKNNNCCGCLRKKFGCAFEKEAQKSAGAGKSSGIDVFAVHSTSSSSKLHQPQ